MFKAYKVIVRRPGNNGSFEGFESSRDKFIHHTLSHRNGYHSYMDARGVTHDVLLHAECNFPLNPPGELMCLGAEVFIRSDIMRSPGVNSLVASAYARGFTRAALTWRFTPCSNNFLDPLPPYLEGVPPYIDVMATQLSLGIVEGFRGVGGVLEFSCHKEQLRRWIVRGALIAFERYGNSEQLNRMWWKLIRLLNTSSHPRLLSIEVHKDKVEVVTLDRFMKKELPVEHGINTPY